MNRTGGSPSVGKPTGSFAHWSVASQLVEEVQQESHMNIPLLFGGCVQLRENCKAFAVRRQIVVEGSAEVAKLLIGPHARLAGSERFGLHFIVRHHDAVVRILEE